MNRSTNNHDYNQYQSAMRTLILDIIGEVPKQIHALADILQKKVSSANVRLCFTEEVKDGRSPRFSVNRPLALKGKKIALNGITITIRDIVFTNQENQESDSSSVYTDYYYETLFSITYE
jgi:hypothetical protein